MRASLFIAAAVVAVPFVNAPATAADHVSPAIGAAVADSTRPPADTARDAVRKPAQMLALAGLKPGEQVVELLPGGGYYTRLISLIVGPGGHVYALNPPPRPNPQGGEGAAMMSMSPVEMLAKDPHYGNITVLPISAITSDPPTTPQVDLFWTSDNYHDLHNQPNADLVAFNKHVFATLKSGGVYIVIDHAAAAGHGANDTKTLHRIDPETVKSEVEAAGFKLAGSSDALHLADDTHTINVHDPAVRGHTDHFALKFVKP